MFIKEEDEVVVVHPKKEKVCRDEVMIALLSSENFERNDRRNRKKTNKKKESYREDKYSRWN